MQGGPHAPVLVDGGWQGVHPTCSVPFLLELSVDQGLRAGPAFSRYSHTAVVETTARIDVGRDVLFFAFLILLANDRALVAAEVSLCSCSRIYPSSTHSGSGSIVINRSLSPVTQRFNFCAFRLSICGNSFWTTTGRWLVAPGS